MIYTGLAKLVCPVISFFVRAVKSPQCQTGIQVSCPMNPSQLSFCQTFYQKHQEIEEVKSIGDEFCTEMNCCEANQ